jgi:hypothetical protein
MSGPTERVEREVPRDDVPDHALGLRLNERAPRPEQPGVHVARLGRHPLLELLRGVPGAPRDPEDLD